MIEFLRLRLSPIDNRLKVIIDESQVGDGEDLSVLPFDGQANRCHTVLKALDAITFHSTDFQGEGEQEWMVEKGLLEANKLAFHPQMRETIGEHLYQVLFPPQSYQASGNVRRLLQSAIAHAASNNQQLHIELRADENVGHYARLFDYPWELLRDEQDFLLKSRVTLSRYISYGRASPKRPTVEHINVLLISSTADDPHNKLKPFRAEEHERILVSLQKAKQEGHIDLAILNPATIRELGNYLTTHRNDKAPNVIHFNGHGVFGKQCTNPQCKNVETEKSTVLCSLCKSTLSKPQGFLLFEGEGLASHAYVSAERFAAELGVANLQKDDRQTQQGIALVFLSACESAKARVNDSVFNGVAQSLIQERIPAIIAMQFLIGVTEAADFAERFYRSLGEEDPLGLAVSKARVAMDFENHQWYCPVLYLRWQDNEGGNIFVERKLQTTTISRPLADVIAVSTAPAPRESFVGRKKEIEELKSIITSGNTPHSIIALVGMGGIGKTALAEKLAFELRAAFPGGILWSDLRDKRNVDPMPVLSNWTQLLDRTQPFRSDISSQVTSQTSVEKARAIIARQIQLAGRVLMILDDVSEEWLKGVQILLEARPPSVPVLFTTRNDELAIALGAHVHSLDILPSEEAHQLLSKLINQERMNNEQEAVEHLIDLLGALPLALELAGNLARLHLQKKTWHIKDLCEDIETTSANQTLQLTGQKGLDATFSLSYESLEERLKALFRVLGCFASAPIGISHVLAVLEAIPPKTSYSPKNLWERLFPFTNRPQSAKSNILNEEQIEHDLDELVRHSLIHWDEREETETRYTLHPLLRDYSIRLLTQTHEFTTASTAHTAHYLAYAYRYRHSSYNGYAALETERLNILLAMDRAYREEQWEQVCRFTKALDNPNSPYLQTYGYWYELRIRLEKGIYAAKMAGNQGDEAVFAGNLAILLMNTGDIARARQEYERVLNIFKQQRNWSDAAKAAHFLGQLEEEKGRFTDAEHRYQECLNLANRAEDRSMLIIARNNLATLAKYKRDYAQAEQLYQQSLTISKEQSDFKGITETQINLAWLAQAKGNKDEAEHLYQEILLSLKHISNNEDTSDILDSLGLIAQNNKNFTEAEQHFRQSKDVAEKLKNRRFIAVTMSHLGDLYQLKGDMAQAQELYEQSLSIFKALNDQKGIAECKLQLGFFAQVHADFSRAKQLYTENLAIIEKLENKSEIARTNSQLGSLYQLMGQYALAKTFHEQSLKLRIELDDLSGQAIDLTNLGFLAQQRTEFHDAKSLYQQGLNAATKAKDNLWITIAQTQLGSLAQFWGNYDEAKDLYQIALELSQATEEKSNIASVWNRLGDLQCSRGEYDEAERLYKQGLDLFRELKDERNIAASISQIGSLTKDKGNHIAAKELFENSLNICTEQKDKVGLMRNLYELGILSQSRGEYDDTKHFYQQSLSLAEQLEDQFAITSIHLLLGKLAQAQGAYREAEQLYEQCLSLFKSWQAKSSVALAQQCLGEVAQSQGNYDRARNLYQASITIFEALQEYVNIALLWSEMGSLCLDEEDITTAKDFHEKSLATCQKIGHMEGIALNLHQLGRIAQSQKNFKNAHHLYQQSMDMFRQMGCRVYFGRVLSHTATLHKDEGDYEKAKQLQLQSLVMAQQIGDQEGIATSLGELGILASLSGNTPDAQQYFQQSLLISEKLGDKKTIAKTKKEIELLAAP